MITPATTPVEVWAPAFSWEPEARLFTVERLLRLERPGGRYCLLCEGIVPYGESKAHVREHRSEQRAWVKDAGKRARREAAERLRQVSRLRAENREVAVS